MRKKERTAITNTTVERYSPAMCVDRNGSWIHESDHDAAMTEARDSRTATIDALQEEVKRLRQEIQGKDALARVNRTVSDLQVCALANAKAEIQKLRNEQIELWRKLQDLTLKKSSQDDARLSDHERSDLWRSLSEEGYKDVTDKPRRKSGTVWTTEDARELYIQVCDAVAYGWEVPWKDIARNLERTVRAVKYKIITDIKSGKI